MGQHLISTEATPVICPTCQELILTGLCEGLRAKVDPFPADPATETVALLAGRWTYTLTLTRILERRVGLTRAGRPVLIEHRCGDPLTFASGPVPLILSRDTEIPY